MKACRQCGKKFAPTNNYQKYCSVSCKRKVYQKPGGVESTEAQYKLISGNWEKYFNRLCQKSLGRGALSKQDCMELLEKQHGKCALSGVELTCILSKGFVCKTNASIDRIDPKGPYVVGNVQLVCVALNKLRIDMSIDEFINWCKKVADYAIQKS